MDKNFIHGMKCQYLCPANRVCSKCGEYVKTHRWWHWFFIITRKKVLRPMGFFDFKYCRICNNWFMERSR